VKSRAKQAVVLSGDLPRPGGCSRSPRRRGLFARLDRRITDRQCNSNVVAQSEPEHHADSDADSKWFTNTWTCVQPDRLDG